MFDDIKSHLDGMDIPEPSKGFEERIIAAAKQQKKQTTNVVEFRVKKRSFISKVGFVSTLAACTALLWVMPAMVSMTNDLQINGLPILVDVSLIDEADFFDISQEDLLSDVL